VTALSQCSNYERWLRTRTGAVGYIS